MKDFNFTFNGTFDLDALLGIEPPTKFELGIKYFCYALSMAVAFFGNLCILVVILRTKSLRTKFNFYILNLALSDMFMPTICMWIHLVSSTNRHWVLGESLCKVHTFLQVMLVCTSIFTLTVVTLDRFLATVAPTRVWLTQRCQPIVIVLIWVAAFSIALPWLLYQVYAEIDDRFIGHEVICESRFPSLLARKVYYVSFFILVMMVPLFLMFVLIVVTVIKDDNARPAGASQTPGAEMRRKACYMVLTVVVVLCVCWTPQQSIVLWDVYRDRNQRPNGIKDLHYITLYMAYTSSAINPIIYFIYNKCFRHAFSQMIKCRGDNTDMEVAPERSTHITIEPSTEIVEMSSLNEELSTNVHHAALFATDSSTSATGPTASSSGCRTCSRQLSTPIGSTPGVSEPVASTSENVTEVEDFTKISDSD